MSEPAIEISNIMSARGVALLRSFRSVFAALDDHRAKMPHEASTVIAAVVSHLRSSDPVAASAVPSVEMPVVSSPAITPVIEAATEVERDLPDGHGYRLALITSVVTAPVVVLTLRDPSEAATVAFELGQAEQLQADIAAVRAAVRRG